MGTPSWQDLSPEQAHDVARGPAYDSTDDVVRDAPRLFGLCCLGALAGAVAFRYLKTRPKCPEPRHPSDYDELQPEFAEALRSHRSALKRVRARAEESARLAREELDALGKVEID
jgi:hypothetical protein